MFQPKERSRGMDRGVPHHLSQRRSSTRHRAALAVVVLALAVLTIGGIAARPVSAQSTPAAAPARSTASTVIDGTHKVVQIAAIIVGGIWAYYKFFRGRTFRPRLEPTLEASIIQIASLRHLKVKARVKNVGLSRVVIDREVSGLRVFVYEPPDGFAADKVSQIDWQRVRTVDVFKDHGWVEPGETIDDNWLFSVANHQAAAFRLELKLAGPKTDWYANAVVEAAARPPSGVVSNVLGRLLRWPKSEHSGGLHER